jgi:hypothetical protein
VRKIRISRLAAASITAAGVTVALSGCIPAAIVAEHAAAKPPTTPGGHSSYDGEPLTEYASGTVRLAASSKWCVTWVSAKGPVEDDPVLLEPCIPEDPAQQWTMQRTDGGFGITFINGTPLALGQKGTSPVTRLVNATGQDPAVSYILRFIPSADAYVIEVSFSGVRQLTAPEHVTAGIKIYRLMWDDPRLASKFTTEWLLPPWERYNPALISSITR